MHTLGPSQIDDDVVYLRTLIGSPVATGEDDRWYDPATALKVRTFQAKMGKPQTGIVDDALWADLERELPGISEDVAPTSPYAKVTVTKPRPANTLVMDPIEITGKVSGGLLIAGGLGLLALAYLFMNKGAQSAQTRSRKKTRSYRRR